MTSDDHFISSAQNDTVKLVRKLGKSRSERYTHSLFICEHVASILDCLTHSPERISFLCIRDCSDIEIEPELLKSIPVYRIKESLFSSLSTLKSSSGILAVCHIPTYSDAEIAKILADTSSQLVLCDQLTNPANFGAIIRNAIAFHLDAILYTPDSVDPFHPDSIRAMAGNFFQKPIIRCDDLLFNKLLDRSFHCYALSPHGDTRLGESDISIQHPSLFIFGSEAHGIRSTFITEHDDKISTLTIPMDDSIESLNVAVSSGILFFYLNQ